MAGPGRVGAALGPSGSVIRHPKWIHNGVRRSGMATVTLKKVPEELVRMLKDEARLNRRSLNQEALARLESTLAPAPRRNGAQAVTALRRLHKRLAGVPPLTDALLRRAKNDGRR